MTLKKSQLASELKKRLDELTAECAEVYRRRQEALARNDVREAERLERASVDLGQLHFDLLIALERADPSPKAKRVFDYLRAMT